MKPFILTLAMIGSFGCASSQKEDLKDIFLTAKEGNDEAATSKIKAAKYETYGETTLYSDDDSNGYTTRTYLRFINDLLKECKGYVNEARAFKLDSQVQMSDLKRKGSQIEINFRKKCDFTEDSWSGEMMNKIKLYTDVDFSEVISAIKLDFGKEWSRVERGFSDTDAKEAKQTEEAEALETQRKNSPEYIGKQICEYESGVKGYEKVIASENEAAQSSGYVDKVRLYKAGKMIQQYKIILNKLRGQYKQKSRSDFLLTSCNTN